MKSLSTSRKIRVFRHAKDLLRPAAEPISFSPMFNTPTSNNLLPPPASRLAPLAFFLKPPNPAYFVNFLHHIHSP